MLTISEPKIAGFTPRWSAFPGFSLLFDNPPSAYRLNRGLEELSCDVLNDPNLDFYRRVRATLEAQNLDLLLQTYLFCALPPESYHVTAFDVANQADLTRSKSDCLDSLRDLLVSPFDPERFSHPILEEASSSALASDDWNLSFRFVVARISGRVLIIQLAPYGPEDQKRFDHFMEKRRELHHTYRSQFGFGAGPNFTPHLSLGYFANAEGAELAKTAQSAWSDAIGESVNDLPLRFDTISMHGFRSMAEFFRLPRRT